MCSSSYHQKVVAPCAKGHQLHQLNRFPQWHVTIHCPINHSTQESTVHVLKFSTTKNKHSYHTLDMIQKISQNVSNNFKRMFLRNNQR